MAKELPWFKFHADEWLTGDITLEDFDIQGLFISVCAYYWKQDCSTTMAKLKRRYRYAKERQWGVLLEQNYIKVIENDQILISFLKEEHDKRLEESEAKSRNGSLGAKKRWHSHSKAIATPMANNGNIDIEVDIDIDNTQFEEFWNIYDKKTGKSKCLKKFNSLKESEKKLLFENLPKYIKSTPEKKYRKDPLTYLNGKHWEDEIETSTVASDGFNPEWYYGIKL